MCGIFCCISEDCGNNSQGSDEWEKCKELISARGPDDLLEKFESLTETWIGHFAASILWMQGPKLIAQPCIDSNGNILLWNGDIFSGALAGDNVCDTTTILNALQSSSNIVSVFQKVQGPYSFLYFQRSTKLLYFGRDIIGRHSLLFKLDNERKSLVLTSVACRQIKGIIEVPAIGIFVMNLAHTRLNLACYPWKEPDLRFTDVIEALEMSLDVDIDIKETITDTEISITNLHLHPETTDVDYLENVPFTKDFDRTLQYLLENKEISQRVDHLMELLHKAVEIRVKKKPNYCGDCVKRILNEETVTCDHSKVGILFSGGLDSAILTLIAHKCIPQNECIDLINVAFEKPTNASSRNSSKDEMLNTTQQYDVPDRKTGKQTFAELLEICPSRKWNFIETNVTQQELQKYRSSRISDLLYPLCTILDESLGCAVWFASRAKGILSMTNTAYESPCRILLLGMGADELFGGYMRHRTTLKHKGWSALTQELSIELTRISERNLGRDDRIVSDHGRQSRLPYLDENVVEYVQKLKPWERCYPTDKMPTGLGEKLILRLLARKLGFQSTANFPKRAFQFGSRIANSKENAKDISDRL